MRVSIAIAALALAGAVSASARAQDYAYVRGLAATCFTCHGTDGHSVGGIPPSLAGQDKSYLLQQLKEFKAGTRQATIMQQHAKGYTDAQLELIAGYFSGIRAGPGATAPAARGTGY